MTTDRNKRLLDISHYVEDYLEISYGKRTNAEKKILQRYLSGSDYRWNHTLRVAQFGKVIAESEAADEELVLAACLLHNIA